MPIALTAGLPELRHKFSVSRLVERPLISCSCPKNFVSIRYTQLAVGTGECIRGAQARGDDRVPTETYQDSIQPSVGGRENYLSPPWRALCSARIRVLKVAETA